MTEESLFELALNTPAAERAAVLDRECAGNPQLRRRVEALLQADAQPENVLPAKPLLDKTETFAAVRGGSERPGVVITGKYKLLQQIGEGGMGSVWMADQTEPVKRRVAVKLIRVERGNSQTILARFEAERQAIALMDHPHIARLLDAGTTDDGSPFFVMELVKGIPLTEYCDAHQLTILERLQLFQQICSAVQHAHQKGIIHRDLKPTNILIESHDNQPVPKVIDFGLAKATSGMQLTEHTLFTALGTVAGTPLYMAPEQAKFNAIDVDTRADIYALGVILYELLTGTTPIERETFKKAAFDEMLRTIREQEPPTPSKRLSSSESKPSVAANRRTEPAKLGGFVRGELDWIVMKALAKERERRYDSATGFAKDIERFVNHEPVQAGPPTAGYRLRKFVQRNRGQVIAASLVLLALVVGIVGTTLALVEARRQERIAVVEAGEREKARQKTRTALDTLTSDALNGWFTRELTLDPSQKDVLRRLLDQYAEFAAEEGKDPDALKGQVRAILRVGRIQQALGDKPAAGASFRQALALVGTAAAPITPDADGWALVGEANTALAVLTRYDGAYDQLEAYYREALAAQSRAAAGASASHAYRANAAAYRINLAGFLCDRERLDAADEEYRITEAELEKLTPETTGGIISRDNNIATVQFNRAVMAFHRGRLPDAVALNDRAVAGFRRLVAAYPLNVLAEDGLMRTLRQAAEFHAAMNRPAEAEAVQREVIGLGLGLANSFPAMPLYRTLLAGDYSTLANYLHTQGRHPDAAEEAGRGLATIRRVVTDFPDFNEARANLVSALIGYCDILLETRDFKAAEAAAREAVVEDERLTKRGYKPTILFSQRAAALHALATVLQRQGRSAEARTMTKEALSLQARRADANPERADLRNALCQARIHFAQSLIVNGEADEAITELRSILPEIDRVAPETRQRWRAAVIFYLGKATGVAAHWAESEDWAGQAVELYTTLSRDNQEYAEYKGFLTQAHWHRGTARDMLKRPVDAAADWQAAAELAVEPMDKAYYRAHRGASLARAGDATGAAAEFATAVQQAEELLKGADLPGVTLYDAAAVYAQAAGGLDDPAAAEAHATTAVRLLVRAAAAGYLNDAARVKDFKDNVAFKSLSDRADFRALLASLEQPAPAAAERGSPPGH